jgi:hypothetical protein
VGSICFGCDGLAIIESAISKLPMDFSLHAQRLERGVAGVGVETGLELGEYLARDRWDVADACHWQKVEFSRFVTPFFMSHEFVAFGATSVQAIV